jgi:hypothetical protein
MLLFVILRNPVYGLRIDGQAMEIDRNGNIRRLLLRDIDFIEITTWSDSSDATIHLKSGDLHQIPQMARPPVIVFQNVLEGRGIAVTKD